VRARAGSYAALASLTLLLPAPEPALGWSLAGDADAPGVVFACKGSV